MRHAGSSSPLVAVTGTDVPRNATARERATVGDAHRPTALEAASLVEDSVEELRRRFLCGNDPVWRYIYIPV